MILKINGVQVALTQECPVNFTEQTVTQTADRLLAKVDWAEVGLKFAVSSLALYFLVGAVPATGGFALISLLQKGAFWVGMAVSIWGVYLWQIGAPNWKEQIAKGVIGYILVLVLPLLFVTIQQSHIGMQ